MSASDVSTTSFSAYVGLGRALGSTQTTGGTAYPFSYNYFPVGLQSVTYPSGRSITYTYDVAGRILSVGGPKTYASGLSYASFGGLQSMQYGNNVVETITYSRPAPADCHQREFERNVSAGPVPVPLPEPGADSPRFRSPVLL